MSPKFAQQVAQETNVVVLRQLVLQLALDNERLQAENAALQQQIAELEGQLAGLNPETQAEEAKRLREIIARLRHQLHGPSSERHRPPPDAPADPNQAKQKQTGHGRQPQPQLEVEIVEHEVPEAERICPCCGKVMVPLGDQYEESEEIDVIPRRYILRKHRRRKYRCPGHDHVLTAPGPDKLMAGGRYSPAFAVEVAVDKYAFHLPLERQVQAMKQAGLRVTTQTLWDQLNALARLLEPTYQAILKRILQEPVISADETRWPLLANGRIQENKNCYAWCLLGTNLVGFHILDSRSQEAGRRVLENYHGLVMADGYEVYAALARGDPPPFQVAHCWAHVRRKFVEVQANAPEVCEEALTLIKGLFANERKAKAMLPMERLQFRQAHSRPIVEALFTWADHQQILPRSGLAEAINYLKNLKPGLIKFLDDPAIPLDNNACERAQRGLVLGRKNFYGSRSRRGNEVAAIFYSLIESAKLTGVDPKAYLQTLTRDALKNPETVLFPADFKQSKTE